MPRGGHRARRLRQSLSARFLSGELTEADFPSLPRSSQEAISTWTRNSSGRLIPEYVLDPRDLADSEDSADDHCDPRRSSPRREQPSSSAAGFTPGLPRRQVPSSPQESATQRTHFRLPERYPRQSRSRSVSPCSPVRRVILRTSESANPFRPCISDHNSVDASLPFSEVSQRYSRLRTAAAAAVQPKHRPSPRPAIIVTDEASPESEPRRDRSRPRLPVRYR
jgi:hypothetical protein